MGIKNLPEASLGVSYYDQAIKREPPCFLSQLRSLSEIASLKCERSLCLDTCSNGDLQLLEAVY